MQADPSDIFVAFDYFVTAYHLADWVNPDSKAARREFEAKEPRLVIVGQIANGAKHFEARAWDEVAELSTRDGYWGRGYFSLRYWSRRYRPRPRIVIVLTDAEAARLGQPELEILDTAKRITAFWRRELGLEIVWRAR